MRIYPVKKKSSFHYEMLAIPWAFVNGLFVGGWLLRKGREWMEHGPQD
ncbi:MAG: hypothetical protein ACM3UZ_00580 [Acidobacteriota bacterium]